MKNWSLNDTYKIFHILSVKEIDEVAFNWGLLCMQKGTTWRTNFGTLKATKFKIQKWILPIIIIFLLFFSNMKVVSE